VIAAFDRTNLFTLTNERNDAAIVAVNGVEGKADISLCQSRWRVVAPPEGWSVATFAREFGALVEQVMGSLDDVSMPPRILREAAVVLTTPEGALMRVQLPDSRFDRLSRRTERQRNALTHGPGTTDAAILSVDDFVVVLARFIGQEVTRQATTRPGPLVEFERQRVQAVDLMRDWTLARPRMMFSGRRRTDAVLGRDALQLGRGAFRTWLHASVNLALEREALETGVDPGLNWATIPVRPEQTRQRTS
jgi:hypothetical protein